MITEYEVTVSPVTYRVGRYPWERLSEVGDELALFGKSFNYDSARQSIGSYAKRRGWKKIRGRNMGLTSRGWVGQFVRVE